MSHTPSTDAPFNTGVHQHLLELGYTFTKHGADWRDEGNGETGPCVVGGPAWCEYADEDEYIVVDEHGSVHGPMFWVSA